MKLQKSDSQRVRLLFLHQNGLTNDGVCKLHKAEKGDPDIYRRREGKDKKVIHIHKCHKTGVFDLYTELSTLSTGKMRNGRFVGL